MGLLDFLFGKQKHQSAPNNKAQSQRYDQGYHNGYRDAYEEGTSEDWECTCENQGINPCDSSFDTHHDEDSFQEDEYDNYEDDSDSCPEVWY